MRATIERRLEAEKQLTPELSAILKESGQFGVIQADALLVMDLDLCVKCDNCVKACESLHGASRLIRTGIQLGKYLIPAACRHCDDPKCMNSCPTGAIKRRPEGEIYFQYDMCIGCGNCAIACPYDNIAMIETGKFDAAQTAESRNPWSENSSARTRFLHMPSSKVYGVESSPVTSRAATSGSNPASGNAFSAAIKRRGSRLSQPPNRNRRPQRTFPPPIPSSAIYATGSHSWDAYMRARPAPR